MLKKDSGKTKNGKKRLEIIDEYYVEEPVKTKKLYEVLIPRSQHANANTGYFIQNGILTESGIQRSALKPRRPPSERAVEEIIIHVSKAKSAKKEPKQKKVAFGVSVSQSQGAGATTVSSAGATTAPGILTLTPATASQQFTSQPVHTIYQTSPPQTASTAPGSAVTFHTYPTAQQILQFNPYSPPQQLPPPPPRSFYYPVNGRDMFAQIAQITDNVFLCACHALQVSKVRNLGITHVINATMEIADLNAPEIQTIRIHINDDPKSKLSAHFDKVADKMDKVKKAGGRVLVHCVAGVSRSASLVIAYLMKYHRMTLLEAYNHVKARRPVIRPNIGFFRQLIEYEKKLFGGRSTVKFINSVCGPIPEVYQDEVKNMVMLG